MTEQVRALINREHHVSEKRRRMPNIERAAQFAPFAALSGYADCIDDAGYIPEAERKLDEAASQDLNTAIARLQGLPEDKRIADITYVVRDVKYGPKYTTSRVLIRSLDLAARLMMLECGEVVRLDDVCRIRMAGEEPPTDSEHI